MDLIICLMVYLITLIDFWWAEITKVLSIPVVRLLVNPLS